MLNTWQDWVGTFTGVVALTVVSLPVALLTVCGLALLRRRRRSRSAWRTALADVGMVYGTVPWVWMILLPGERPGEVLGPLNLIPLRDLMDMDTGQVLGNLAVFASFGFFAPLRFAALASLRRILLLTAGSSLVLEIVQYLWLDRVSSVDDVLLNAAGAGLSALASYRWWCTSSARLDTAPIYRAA